MADQPYSRVARVGTGIVDNLPVRGHRVRVANNTHREETKRVEPGAPSPVSHSPSKRAALTVVPRSGTELSHAQTEFNRLMKRLETARLKHAREQARLDALVVVCGAQWMPLVHEMHRTKYQMVHHGVEAMKKCKLTARRRKRLGRHFKRGAGDLLDDPCGLNDEHIDRLKAIVDELHDPMEDELMEEIRAGEFDLMRELVESTARRAGLDLDLSDLDIDAESEDFDRVLRERIEAATGDGGTRRPQGVEKRPRKMSKAQVEKERRRQEAEEAKQRDLKTLYKHLAKLLHPDLESDFSRRSQKEEWMKRLTTAYAEADLRELLCIEMEWLGVESSNLTNASDEKLKVYNMVLKEQIAQLREQTETLAMMPQYAALAPFMHPFFGTLPHPQTVVTELGHIIRKQQEYVGNLLAGGPACTQLLIQWADAPPPETIIFG